MVNQLVQRLTNLDFKHLINFKKLKVYIYPNLQGLLLGLFVFFCFLISVFYENNSGLLISIVIFFIFFISIFVSHQNINNLRINFLTEYLVESNKTELINFKIINDTKEKKLNIHLMPILLGGIHQLANITAPGLNPSRAKHMIKDLKISIKQAKKNNLNLEISKAILKKYQKLSMQGDGDLDTSSLIKLIK